MIGSVSASNDSTGNSSMLCTLKLDGTFLFASVRSISLDGDLTDSGGDTISDVNTGDTCVSHDVINVEAGVHTVDLNLSSVSAGTELFAGTLNVLFAPFDGSGG